MTRDEAELLVKVELKDGVPAVAPRVERFEARLTSTGWKFASGDSIRDPGVRAQGLVRRCGWAFSYDLEEESRLGYIEKHGHAPAHVLELFPSLLVVRVYDDTRELVVGI